MSEVETTAFVASATVRAPRQRVRRVSRRASTPHWFVFLIVLIVAFSMIPLGSNRPIFWMVNAVGVSLLALVYAAISRRREAPILPTGPILFPAALIMMVVTGWMVLQALPIAAAFPGILGSMPSDVSHGGLQSISIDPSASLGMALRYGTYALLFFICCQSFVRYGNADLALALVFIAIVGQAVFALIALTQLDDTILFTKKWAYEGYATGTYVNRNTFATVMAFGLVIGTAQALHVWSERKPPSRRNWRAWLSHSFKLALSGFGVYVAGMALIAAALAASGSRMGAGAAIVGVVFIAIIALTKKSIPGRIALGSVLALCLAAGSVAIYNGGAVFDRLGSVERDADVRMELYRQTAELVMSKPIVGSGAGSFEDAFAVVQALPISPDIVWNRAHNLYLELAVELGIPATLAILFAVALLAGFAFSVALRREFGWAAPAAAAGVTLVAAIHSLVDFSLQIQSVVLIFVTVLAIGVSQSVKLKES